MKKKIMLTSTKANAGKSIVAIGMFLKLKELNKNPGYFKPIGDTMSNIQKSRSDKDVSIISAVIDRKHSPSEICPFYLNPKQYFDEIESMDKNSINEKIEDAFGIIANNSDYIIIEGNHFMAQYSPINLDDVYFARKFEASVIICAPISDDNDINLIVTSYEYLVSQKIPIVGVILNPLTKISETRIKRYHIKLLEERGIKVIGSLKNSRDLEKPTIAEIMDATDTELYSGDFLKVKNTLINSFVIGAMGADPALKIFRESVAKCVITGGDRSDIALAAMDTSTNLIIFTGNIKPPQRIVSVAEEKGIPLLISKNDTYTLIEKIRQIVLHIQPAEIQICRDQVENLNWNLIQS